MKRGDQKNRQEIQVEGWGRVDLVYGLLSHCHIPVESKKLYHCLIWHFWDIAVVQVAFCRKGTLAMLI